MQGQVVLGLSLSHNSSAAFVNHTCHVLFASSEERVFSQYNDDNFLKNTKAFPLGAITAGLKEKEIDTSAISHVTWSHYEAPDLYNFVFRSLPQKLRTFLLNDHEASEILSMVLDIDNQDQLLTFRKTYSYSENLNSINRLIAIILQNIFNIRPQTISRIDHHTSHAYGAFKTSGFSNDAIVITLDGFGDGVSGQVFKTENSRLVCIPSNTIKSVGSPGLFYQYVTGYMRLKNNERLKMLRDEYKLLAREPYSAKKYDYLPRLIKNQISQYKNTIVWSEELISSEDMDKLYDQYQPIKEINIFNAAQKKFDTMLKNAKDEGFSEFDIARAVQKIFQEVVLTWIKTAIKSFCPTKLVLSGGCFYNVKLNYMIKQLDGVEKLWVFPAAGDEGNAIGSACALICENDDVAPQRLSHMFIGKTYRHDEVTDAIRYVSNQTKFRLRFENLWDTDTRVNLISDLLAEKKIVHIANTEMGVEFGPRALMVRSTLAQATSDAAREQIRRLFNRDAYMPLAPIIKAEYAWQYLIGFNAATDLELSKYMIIAYPCRESFAEKYPAVVHPYHIEDREVYGAHYSTRPQLVTRQDALLAWTILDSYEKKTGEFALVNTSFNSHHSPILGDIVLLLCDWLSMSGESHLFLGNYYLNSQENKKV